MPFSPLVTLLLPPLRAFDDDGIRCLLMFCYARVARICLIRAATYTLAMLPTYASDGGHIERDIILHDAARRYAMREMFAL